MDTSDYLCILGVKAKFFTDEIQKNCRDNGIGGKRRREYSYDEIEIH